jgi:hypothetical protein
MAPLLNMRLRVAEPTMSFPYSKLHPFHSLRAGLTIAWWLLAPLTPQDQDLALLLLRHLCALCLCKAALYHTAQKRAPYPLLTLSGSCGHVGVEVRSLDKSRRWMEGIVVATSPNPMWLALGLLLGHGRNFRDETTSALWTVDGDPSHLSWSADTHQCYCIRVFFTIPRIQLRVLAQLSVPDQISKHTAGQLVVILRLTAQASTTNDKLITPM